MKVSRQICDLILYILFCLLFLQSFAELYNDNNSGKPLLHNPASAFLGIIMSNEPLPHVAC